MTAESAPFPVFRFVGHSGVGKTTLLESLVGVLVASGVRVAVAKDTHHQVELDTPGKDTWRYSQAGADLVVLATDGRLQLSQRCPQRPTLPEIAALVRQSSDLLLAEGFRYAAEPAILVWRASHGRAWPDVSGPIVAVASDQPTLLAIPRFEFHQVDALADFLLSYPASS
jgi:molybdopterin-guanine dinucleotide biosynthesis protein MobB